ncbi:hypothetical protein [Paucibacter soli]|uniref:hypothetical protein n=1 Tax=Paucibacter soli TaxID=3133433 RepID=UPI0030A22012
MLELNGNHVAALDDEDLRVLVAKLCEAELQRNALPVSAILSGGNQTAQDCGINVAVELDAFVSLAGLDFVPKPLTGFQVKCEDMPEVDCAPRCRFSFCRFGTAQHGSWIRLDSRNLA